MLICHRAGFSSSNDKYETHRCNPVENFCTSLSLDCHQMYVQLQHTGHAKVWIPFTVSHPFETVVTLAGAWRLYPSPPSAPPNLKTLQ